MYIESPRVQSLPVRKGFKYIYYLRDPCTNEVRFIGATARYAYTWHRHCDNGAGSVDKRAWIAELRKSYLWPLIEAVEVVSDTEAGEAVKAHIRKGEALGWELFNE